MQLRLSVSVPTGPARAPGRATAGGANPNSLLDVLVTAPAGTPLRAAAGQLASLAGLAEPVFHVGARRVAEDHPLGVPPLVDGAVLTADQPASALPPPGNLELHVIGGPDAGGVHLLTPPAPGHAALRLTIGRGAEADIRIEDPDLSRRHAALSVSLDWVRLADCGSTNGTVLGGNRIGEEPVLLPPQTPVRLGETTLLLRHGEESLEVEPDRLGRVLVRVVPRVSAEVPAPRFVLPTPPGARGLPAARRRAQAAFEQAKAATEAKISAALSVESGLRRTRYPDPAALLTTALRPGLGLWSRGRDQPELLELRLGTARLPSSVTVGQGSRSFRPRVPAAPVTVDLAGIGVLGLVAADGPETAAAEPNLPPHDLLGSERTDAGTSGSYSVRALARSLVAQLAALCSPLDVDLVVLCTDGGAERWRWTTWLPHCAPQDGQNCRAMVGFDGDQAAARLAELTVRLEARQGALRGSDEPWPGRRTVLLLDRGESAVGAPYPPELLRLLVEGPRVGMHAIVLANRREDLPELVGAVATVGGEVHTRLRLEQPEKLTQQGILADLTSPQWAIRFAHALAPLRDSREGGVQGIQGTNQRQLPEEARLLPLLGLDLLTPTKLSALWTAVRERPPGGRDELDERRDIEEYGSGVGLPVVLGADSHGAVRAELTGHHILVGGASGSGISEALRSILCSAALPTPPERLRVLLVSGGNGPSWGETARLPHVALHADNEAELRHVLLAAREERHGSERLLIGVDGLDRVAVRHPWFIKELTELAQEGRGHGVHLLLGITLDDGPARRLLDGELCEELDLRLALRTYGPEESRRMVSLPDAAAIRPSLPGRGWLALPDGRVLPVQVPRVSGRMASSATARAHVAVDDWRRLGDQLPNRGLGGTGALPLQPGAPTDLALLIESAGRAAMARTPSPRAAAATR
ncbi:FHA domain-containing protein [Actinospica sp.]|jgi:S-DNA-T family DNA segregation ATPase FtsK/SpoIIIE|uniref:FHA domain-containing protein n=1 Tax=Actinospica sp. TaxID=1872142 RepID=UPI002C0A9402|nr:FHA domain-containing protein [Actinospica sp.]HWG27876.1 FHA domain-containing protein [Actinospica sp.]